MPFYILINICVICFCLCAIFNACMDVITCPDYYEGGEKTDDPAELFFPISPRKPFLPITIDEHD